MRILMTALLLVCLIAACDDREKTRAEHWLSLPETERELYVLGFIAGRKAGCMDAGANVDECFGPYHKLNQDDYAKFKAMCVSIINERYKSDDRCKNIPADILLHYFTMSIAFPPEDQVKEFEKLIDHFVDPNKMVDKVTHP